MFFYFVIKKIKVSPNNLKFIIMCAFFSVFYKEIYFLPINLYIPVENKNDLELDFKVFFFIDSCCQGR